MGFFNFFNKDEENNNTPQHQPEPVRSTTQSQGQEVFLDLNKGGLLNLEKNQFLNLSKADISLRDIRVAAGWDVVDRGQDYDLDLCAHLFDGNDKLIDIVYFGRLYSSGVRLDGDNLTGEGDGDDENIFINFNKVDSYVKKITIGVVIYAGRRRRQYFSKVKNAYVRLVDESTGKEVARINLTEDAGETTAVVFAELRRTNDEWLFKSIKEFKNSDIQNLLK